jgi:hypothetical protein
VYKFQALGLPVEARFLGGSWRRYFGELVAPGKEEALTWQEN